MVDLEVEVDSEAEVAAFKVEVAEASAVEVVAVVATEVVVEDHRNSKNHLKITTNYLEFQETQMMPLSRKSSKN